MNSITEKLATRFGLLALAVLCIAIIFMANLTLRNWRVDLTENNLYSISQGTKNIVRNIDEPINLYYFFSDSASGEATQLRSYAQRVREVLEGFSLVAGDKINLQIIDPQPFSEAEDQAAQFGLQAVPVGAGESLYFGLAGTNSVDDTAIIPFFQADKETFLEYDLAKLIDSLANPKRPVIGVLSTLSMGPGFDPATRQQTPAWMIWEQMEQLFDLRTVDQTAAQIDAEIDVLMVVHPKGLTEATQMAIDQFILAGGRALVFVDPYAEADQPPQDPNNPAAMFTAVRASSLTRLFDAWGVKFNDSEFVADNRYALMVSDQRGQQPVRHLGLLGFTGDGLNQEDVVSGDLNTINLGYAGEISLKDGAPVTMSPLLVSSTESDNIGSDRLTFLQSPDVLRQDFDVDGMARVIAARIQGEVPSAFVDAAPDGADSARLAKSDGEINVIIIGDVDMLTDRFWVQVQNFFGRRMASAFANNGDFVFNALDNLTGNSDLISIRGRASFRRPFAKVDELTRIADEKFRATEERLQQELQQTEQRLGELQANREDGNTLILSDEQRLEIDKFVEQKLRIRKELRQVRRDLDKDIKTLGGWLKAINIVAVPLLVILLAIYLGWRRNRRAAQQRGG